MCIFQYCLFAENCIEDQDDQNIVSDWMGHMYGQVFVTAYVVLIAIIFIIYMSSGTESLLVWKWGNDHFSEDTDDTPDRPAELERRTRRQCRTPSESTSLDLNSNSIHHRNNRKLYVIPECDEEYVNIIESDRGDLTITINLGSVPSCSTSVNNYN